MMSLLKVRDVITDDEFNAKLDLLDQDGKYELLAERMIGDLVRVADSLPDEERERLKELDLSYGEFIRQMIAWDKSHKVIASLQESRKKQLEIA